MDNCTDKSRDCVVVAYGRSPVGKAPKGKFKLMHPVELGGQTLAGVLKKLPNLDPESIDNVIMGCSRVNDTQSQDIARQILVRAGLPMTIPGLTVSSFCSSGLNAIILGASMILAGEADCIVAGGIEMNSRVQNAKGTECPWILEQYPDMYLSVGEQGENLCDSKNYTRRACEAFGELSQKKACAAQAAGNFDDEIIPIIAPTEDGKFVTVYKDEGTRPDTNLETLMTLKTPFRENGRLSAGSSAQTSDGASALVLMTSEKAKEIGAIPIARYIAGSSGADVCKELAPPVIRAIDKLFGRIDLTLEDMDVYELNEAFAPVVMDVQEHYHLDPDKINPNGGAIALGHPLGATGAILTCKAISELKRRNGKYGLIAMCANMGLAGALVIEKL